jgi:hypothetical protein
VKRTNDFAGEDDGALHAPYKNWPPVVESLLGLESAGVEGLT